MQDGPLIGICAAREFARWSVWAQEAVVVAQSYVEAVQRAGGSALLLVPDKRHLERPLALLRLVDGLMLAGGSDLDPSFYGAPSHPQSEPPDRLRDRFELALCRAALAVDLPLLGICRGMQVINVALGGTLLQHLPERDGGAEHRRCLGTFKGNGHPVAVVPNTLTERVVGGPTHLVHSHHHQGVAALGEGLVVGARASHDGLIEAIERPDRTFFLGVQWHPEADPDSPVVAALVAAAGGRLGTPRRRRQRSKAAG